MAKKPTLSLCMIVRDEASFLKKCLKSINPILDEIIIVDTGSKDNTIAIAKSFDAKVIKHKWNDNFSEARNISLKHATKDWILVLDADEIISKRDLKKVKKLLEKEDCDAFLFVQRNYFKERKPSTLEVSSLNDTYTESKPYSGWFPSPLVRLFRNNKGYEFTGMIHELVEPSIEQKGDEIKSTQIPIHHFRAEKSKEFDSKRRQRYLNLGKKQIKLTPNNPKPYYEVGTLYLSDKRLDDAIPFLEKSLQLIESSKKPQKHVNTYGYVSYALGFAYLEKEDYENAVKCFEKVLRHYPKALMTYFFLAQAYTALNNFRKAIKVYRKAAELDPNNEETHNNLANTYSRVSMFEDAIREYKIAISLAPKNAAIHRNLGATYFGIKKYASAYNSFKRAVELNPEFKKDLKEVLGKLEGVKDKVLDVEYSFSIDDME